MIVVMKDVMSASTTEYDKVRGSTPRMGYTFSHNIHFDALPANQPFPSKTKISTHIGMFCLGWNHQDLGNRENNRYLDT